MKGFSQSIVTAMVLAVFAATSHATLVSITNVTGANGAQITTNPPNPVSKDPNQGILLAWDEVQNFQLLQDLRVDRVADPNASFILPDGSGYKIRAGTIVSSHYIQWDNGSGASNTVGATITLDSDIFAFITADQKMFDSDAPLGLPGLDYNDFGSRGLESGDTTTINGSAVDINWTATSPGDWTRLITAFSPAAAFAELTTNSDPENATTVAFGNVRVGTTAQEDLTVTNTGDFGSFLNATLPGASGDFAPTTAAPLPSLGQNESASRTYSYTPDARGADNLSLADIVSEDDPDADQSVALSGNGVGPVFDASLAPGSTLDFGTLDQETSDIISVLIDNVTTDGDLGALTDLTINSIGITGPDSAMFSMVGFADGSAIAAGGSLQIDVQFLAGSTDGDFSATLTLFTDEGAALAGDGSDYSYNLVGQTIPEPASALLVGAGGLALLRRRRD